MAKVACIDRKKWKLVRSLGTKKRMLRAGFKGGF